MAFHNVLKFLVAPLLLYRSEHARILNSLANSSHGHCVSLATTGNLGCLIFGSSKVQNAPRSPWPEDPLLNVAYCCGGN